jgi:hypothetical protein
MVQRLTPVRGRGVVGKEPRVYGRGQEAQEVGWIIVPEEGCRVLFHEPLKAVTPGQSMVFYRDGEVLRGGMISALWQCQSYTFTVLAPALTAQRSCELQHSAPFPHPISCLPVNSCQCVALIII